MCACVRACVCARMCLLLLCVYACVCVIDHNSYDAESEKKALMLNANNAGPDERAHPCSHIWAFSVRRYILQYPLIL